MRLSTRQLDTCVQKATVDADMAIRPMTLKDLHQCAPSPVRLRLDQVLSYVKEGQVQGLICYWDCGHGRVFVDGFLVAAHRAKRVGAFLLRALIGMGVEKGWQQLVGYTTPEKSELYRDRKGVTIDGPYYRIVVDLTQYHKGDSHAGNHSRDSS